MAPALHKRSIRFVEIKFTDVPAHTALTPAPMKIPTGNLELTVISTGSEVAGLPVTQIVSLEVRITRTKSPLDGTYAKVELVAPACTIVLTVH